MYLKQLYFHLCCNSFEVYEMTVLVIDRYWFFITDTDTDNLYVYVPITDIQNRYLFTVIK